MAETSGLLNRRGVKPSESSNLSSSAYLKRSEKIIYMDNLNLKDDFKILIPNLLERIEMLKKQGVLVQSQPLGFMRLALEGQKNNEEGHFLHVWMPGLPTQEGGPCMHTHVFDMESRVLLGSIRDVMLVPKEDSRGKYQLAGAVCKEEYCLPFKQEGNVNMEVSRVLDVGKGEIYKIEKDNFHETLVTGDGVSVTLMRKYNVDQKDPVLAIPVGIEIPKDTFRRDQIDQEFAWEKIKELLNKCP